MSQVREEAIIRFRRFVYETAESTEKISCDLKAASCIVENQIVERKVVVEIK